jgi:hypothetical protein
MIEKVRLKVWQWLWLLLLGSLLPIYNILLNNYMITFGMNVFYYIIAVMATNLVFSFIMLINFNYFRTLLRSERRLDSAFMLYVLSVSFGSFFGKLPSNVGLFVIPFVVIYFWEIKNILDDFPRE